MHGNQAVIFSCRVWKILNVRCSRAVFAGTCSILLYVHYVYICVLAFRQSAIEISVLEYTLIWFHI